VIKVLESDAIKVLESDKSFSKVRKTNKNTYISVFQEIISK